MESASRAAAGCPAARSRPGTLPGAGLGAELHCADCFSLRPAVALRNLEFDPLAFLKRAVAVRLNCREVDEYVPTTVDRDEAVELILAEPFDSALSHEQQLPTLCSGLGSRPCYAKPVDRGTGWTCCASSACRSRRTDSDRTLHYMVTRSRVLRYPSKIQVAPQGRPAGGWRSFRAGFSENIRSNRRPIRVPSAHAGQMPRIGGCSVRRPRFRPLDTPAGTTATGYPGQRRGARYRRPPACRVRPLPA